MASWTKQCILIINHTWCQPPEDPAFAYVKIDAQIRRIHEQYASLKERAFPDVHHVKSIDNYKLGPTGRKTPKAPQFWPFFVQKPVKILKISQKSYIFFQKNGIWGNLFLIDSTDARDNIE